MNRNITPRIIAVTMVMVLIMLFSNAFAEEIGPDLIMKGVYGSPVTITISSPSYRMLSQFSEERKEMLNRLIGHIGLSVTLDGHVSETVLYIDQDEIYTALETVQGSLRQTAYSFDPENVYETSLSEEKEDVSDFSGFLDSEFHPLNQLLDELYPVFEKIPEAFSEYVRIAGVSLSFKGYGKGVRKVTVPIPESYVTEHFPAAIANLSDTDTGKRWIEKLVFRGSQKIILLYDAAGKLLRVNYDGIVGLAEDSLRKVSVVWRSVRDGETKKDHITLKTPALKGNDRYNLTYEREINRNGSSDDSIQWSMQIDMKDGENKRKITFSGDLATKDGLFGGSAVFTEKQENDERRITIVPELRKENGSEYLGTIEITNYSGKIVLSSIVTDIHVSPGRELSPPNAGTIKTKEQKTGNESHTDQLQDCLNHILIRRLMVLPPEDIEFLSLDIPDEVWDSLMKSII